MTASAQEPLPAETARSRGERRVSYPLKRYRVTDQPARPTAF